MGRVRHGPDHDSRLTSPRTRVGTLVSVTDYGSDLKTRRHFRDDPGTEPRTTRQIPWCPRPQESGRPTVGGNPPPLDPPDPPFETFTTQSIEVITVSVVYPSTVCHVSRGSSSSLVSWTDIVHSDSPNVLCDRNPGPVPYGNFDSGPKETVRSPGPLMDCDGNPQLISDVKHDTQSRSVKRDSYILKSEGMEPSVRLKYSQVTSGPRSL